MTHVLLQPAGSAEAREHYQKTVASPRSLREIDPFLKPESRAELAEIYGETPAAVWGVTAGDGNRNRTKWERVRRGDIVLFTGGGRAFASATVTLSLHNRALANHLWGPNGDGDTWEYLYFLSEVRPESITYGQLATVVPYSSGQDYVVLGFTVLDEAQSANVLDAFNLGSRTYDDPISEDAYADLVKEMAFDPDEAIDEPTRARRRKEQGKLRAYLFGQSKQGSCGLCGRLLPVELLVAAHIKKRSQCSVEERLDYQHIVLAMCRLGCDDLYERGFIGVSEGRVQISTQLPRPAGLLDLVALLDGRQVAAWSPQTAPYFTWHSTNTYRAN